MANPKAFVLLIFWAKHVFSEGNPNILVATTTDPILEQLGSPFTNQESWHPIANLWSCFEIGSPKKKLELKGFPLRLTHFSMEWWGYTRFWKLNIHLTKLVRLHTQYTQVGNEDTRNIKQSSTKPRQYYRKYLCVLNGSAFWDFSNWTCLSNTSGTASTKLRTPTLSLPGMAFRFPLRFMIGSIFKGGIVSKCHIWNQRNTHLHNNHKP